MIGGVARNREAVRLRALGTRLWQAEDDGRDPTWLVSDLHLGEGGGVTEDRFEALLDQVRSAPGGRLLILGDLFDAYAGAPQLRRGAWARLAASLRSTVAAGIPVTVLHGNRDFLLGSAFGRATGCWVVPGGVLLALWGRPVLALHGDELCTDDREYQRSKKVLRHPLFRLFAASLPQGARERIANRLRRHSRAVQAAGRAEPGGVERYHAVRSAVAEALAAIPGDGDPLLVFGHVHRAARGRLAGGEYLVLPAFDETGVCLRADRDGVRFWRVGSGAEDDPGPWPWRP